MGKVQGIINKARTMKLFVGVTDDSWFEYLSSLQDLDEVNFWQPSGRGKFRALNQGAPFLFKLHSPKDYIVGGGFFLYSTLSPLSLAWEAFQEKNGASSFEEMRSRIVNLRRSNDPFEDFTIGCVILKQPFFLDESDWLPVQEWLPAPAWSPNIVTGKSFDMIAEPGKSLWEKIQSLLANRQFTTTPEKRIDEERGSFVKGFLFKPRLGQSSFRIVVTDAYQRSCAVTQERALPVLEAAHIKPFSQSGPHQVNNGILLRSDMYRLFDKGYMTVTPQLHIEVSRRIKEEFENGKYYFTFHGQKVHTPKKHDDSPSPEFLSWHNENVFRG